MLNLILRRLRQENCHEFEASLSYSVRPCFKTKTRTTKPNKQAKTLNIPIRKIKGLKIKD